VPASRPMPEMAHAETDTQVSTGQLIPSRPDPFGVPGAGTKDAADVVLLFQNSHSKAA